MRHLLLPLAVAALAVASHAQILTVTDRFGYTGSVTRYDTLADAQAGTNALGTFSLGAENRDFRVALINGFGPILADQYHLGTNWTAPGSPSNVATGFVQIPLQYGAPTLNAFWDISRTQFTLDVQGSLNAANCRLWDGSALSANQNGDFLDYRLSLVATGLDTATWDATYNTYWSLGEPTAVTGSLRGLFQNTTADGLGFYTFDFDLNLDSWAYEQFGANSDSQYYTPSIFAAPHAVPEPSTYGLIGAGALLALVSLRRLRRTRG